MMLLLASTFGHPRVLNAEDFLHHMVVDMVMKFGIVAAGIVVVAVAMVILWKRLGPRR